MASESVQLSAANVATVVGALTLLVAFATLFTFDLISGAPVSATVIFGAATATMSGVLCSTLGKRLTLGRDYIESRDWLFRTTRFSYESIERVDFRSGHQLMIWVSGRASLIVWPANTSGVEAFISALSERVTQLRKLQISGDLEVE